MTSALCNTIHLNVFTKVCEVLCTTFAKSLLSGFEFLSQKLLYIKNIWNLIKERVGGWKNSVIRSSVNFALHELANKRNMPVKDGK
jgi:hypothetical protein